MRKKSLLTLAPASANVEPSDVLRELVAPSMFFQPNYLPSADWAEYMPFGFWIIEALRPRSLVEIGTGSGNSYFAFLQAADLLRLSLKSFLIDGRTETASSRSNQPRFDELQNYHDSRYLSLIHI